MCHQICHWSFLHVHSDSFSPFYSLEIPRVSNQTKLNEFVIELNRTKLDENRTIKFDVVRSSNEIEQLTFLGVRFPNQIE